MQFSFKKRSKNNAGLLSSQKIGLSNLTLICQAIFIRKSPSCKWDCFARKKGWILKIYVWFSYIMQFSFKKIGSRGGLVQGVVRITFLTKNDYIHQIRVWLSRDMQILLKKLVFGWLSKKIGSTKLMFDLHLPYSFLLKTTGIKWQTIYFKRADSRGMSLLCLKKWLNSISLYLILLCHTIIAKKLIWGQICLLCS